MNRFKDLTVEQLLELRKEHRDWIDDDDCNDGRLTAGSSMDLDLHFDEIDDINEELQRRELESGTV